MVQVIVQFLGLNRAAMLALTPTLVVALALALALVLAQALVLALVLALALASQWIWQLLALARCVFHPGLIWRLGPGYGVGLGSG